MNAADFDGLLKRARNLTGKDPTVSLFIVEKEQAISKAQGTDENTPTKKRQKKSHYI